MPRPPENRKRIVAYVTEETKRQLKAETDKTEPERNTPGKVIDLWAQKAKPKNPERA